MGGVYILENGCLGCMRCEEMVVVLNDGRVVCDECPDGEELNDAGAEGDLLGGG